MLRLCVYCHNYWDLGNISIFTTCIRRMGKVMFSICPPAHTRGGEGCTPSLSRNTSTGPISFRGGGGCHLHPIILPPVLYPFFGLPLWLLSGPFQGVPQSQAEVSCVPLPARTGWGIPNQDKIGYPWLGQRWVPPGQDRVGYSNSQDKDGVPRPVLPSPRTR